MLISIVTFCGWLSFIYFFSQQINLLNTKCVPEAMLPASDCPAVMEPAWALSPRSLQPSGDRAVRVSCSLSISVLVFYCYALVWLWLMQFCQNISFSWLEYIRHFSSSATLSSLRHRADRIKYRLNDSFINSFL